MNSLSRIFSVVLAIVLLAAIIAGCGSEGEDPGATTASAETTADTSEETTESDEPDLPEIDLEGKEYQFLVRFGSDCYNDYWIEVEEMNGEVVNDAVFERNRAVEEKFNIDITALFNTKPDSYATKTVFAGDDSFFAVWDCKTLADAFKSMFISISAIFLCRFYRALLGQKCRRAALHCEEALYDAIRYLDEQPHRPSFSLFQQTDTRKLRSYESV